MGFIGKSNYIGQRIKADPQAGTAPAGLEHSLTRTRLS